MPRVDESSNFEAVEFAGDNFGGDGRMEDDCNVCAAKEKHGK